MQVLCFFGVGAILFWILFGISRRKTTAKDAQKDVTPVYLTLSDKPGRILSGMNQLVASNENVDTASQRWWWLPLLIFAGGFGLVLIDGFLTLIGYTSIIFSLGGIVVWVAAFVLAFALRRNRAKAFPKTYSTAKEIFHTLRDDLRPDGIMLGHLDLTGAMLPGKVVNQTKDQAGRTTQSYRDEWLNLKMKLYDGNVMRVSAAQRIKQRQPYWKRSRISGKSKMKPAKFKGSYQELKVRIAVNPQVYEIRANGLAQGKAIGEYTIAQVDARDGIISLLATSRAENISSGSVLGVLRSAYELLQRKAA